MKGGGPWRPKSPPPRRTRASRGGESFYTVQSLAEYLGVGPDTVYRLIRAGRLPGTMRLGRRFRIPKNAVDALDERAG